MENKTALRITSKSIRQTLDIEKISKEICRKLRNAEFYKNANNVLLYYPSKFEIDLRELLNDDKKFYLPKVEGDELLICRYSEGDNLEKSSFNIYEPCSKPQDAKVLDLVIVPALMVDKNNYRLGYGGGFYDRFLARNEVVSVVPIARALIVDGLPIEDFDVKVDFVISD